MRTHVRPNPPFIPLLGTVLEAMIIHPANRETTLMLVAWRGAALGLMLRTGAIPIVPTVPIWMWGERGQLKPPDTGQQEPLARIPPGTTRHTGWN